MSDQYSLSLAFAVTVLVLSLSCMTLCAIQKASVEQKMTMLIVFSSILFSMGQLAGVASSDMSMQLLSDKLEFIGGINTFYFCALLYFYYFKVKFNSLLKYGLFVIVFFLSFSIAILDLHDLFYRKYWLLEREGVTEIVFEPGILYTTIFGAMIAFAVVITIFFIRQLIIKRSDVENTILLYIIVMLPSIAFSVDVIYEPIIKAVPFSLILVDVLLIYLIIVRRFYDIDTLAHRLVFDSANDALIVLDATKCYTDANRLAKEMFPELAKAKTGKRLSAVSVKAFNTFEKCLEYENVMENRIIDSRTGIPVIIKSKRRNTAKEAQILKKRKQSVKDVPDIEYKGKIFHASSDTIIENEGSKREEIIGFVLWFRDVTADREHTRLLDNYNHDLEVDVAKKTKELKELQEQMIIGFATLVEYKNHVTGGHIKRTAAYCELIGKELKKEGKYSDIIDDTFIETLKSVAPLHDIGKLTIPDDVLDKPGKLTDEEFALIKTHTLKGAEIIDLTLNTGKTNQYYEMAKEVTMYHHEKWDGSGYPRGKKGQDIPLSARIMAVSDFFDALSTERPYKKAFPMEKTFKIMQEESGRHFDPVVLEAFFNVVDEAIELHEKMKDENLTEINDLNQF